MAKLEDKNKVIEIEKQLRLIDESKLELSVKFEQLAELLILNINRVLESEKKYFSNSYSKLIHIYDLYEFPIKYQKSLNRHYFYSRNDKSPNEKYFHVFRFLIIELFNLIYNPNYKSNLKINLYDDKDEKKLSQEKVYKLIFQDWTKDNIFTANDIFLNEYTITLKEKELFSYKLFKSGAKLNLINFTTSSEFVLQSGNESLIAYEPDILVSITDIASCFASKEILPILYLVNNLSPFQSSYKMTLGNLVNSVFDELIVNKNADFDEIFMKSLKQKVLPLFSLSINDKTSAKNLKYDLMHHYQSLKTILEQINLEQPSIEPSFISTEYGMQGRLDLLLESKTDKNRKEIIELKSGSAPNLNFFIVEKDKKYKAGLWYNNIAQANAYNMLLDSNYSGRRGDSSILYSKDNKMPLRNVVNIFETKRKIINTRNEIVNIEKEIASNSLGVLNQLFTHNYSLPDYLHNKIINLTSQIKNLDEIRLAYFSNYLAFQFREILTTKIGAFGNGTSGNGNANGFSSIWNNEAKQSIKIGKINSDLSDFDNMYLYFNIITEKETENNYKQAGDQRVGDQRVGDQIILYEVSDSSNYFCGQIFKGFIKQIDKEFVIISLRNKLISNDYFDNNINWQLRKDSSDNLLYANLPFLLSFLNSDMSDYIINAKKPSFKPVKYLSPELDKHQNNIVEKAIALQNYYLIVGPPGTGKTSYILKNIVEYFYYNTNETILVTAFTNRAVDEICTAIKRIENNILMLRLGSKDSSAHSDILISKLTEKNGLKPVRKQLEGCRIIVSTISSLIKNTEIFEIKEFDTLIIDEASQMSELDTTAIISKAKKFIMIGDDKQLPSIFSQKKEYYDIDNQALNDLSINNMSKSLFSRLKEISVKNSYEYAVGYLSKQARMHSDIMSLANKLFYSGKLELFNKTSQTVDFELSPTPKNKLEEIIKSERIIFINTPISNQQKSNTYEADLCTLIVNYLIAHYNDTQEEQEDYDNKIGIISPFRMQCAEIKKYINNDKISVDTVERYQGSEREHIIISLATSTHYLLDRIQSLDTVDGDLIDRKLNVAITRAKQQLIIMGNENVLRRSPIYSSLIDIIKNNYCFVDYYLVKS